MKKKNTHRRSFGGKTSDFKDNAERNYEKAHLRAYLNGNIRFSMGIRDQYGNLHYFPVKEILTEITE